MPIDYRSAMNAISDVIVNRPVPLREFDQIYMKAGDMLAQAQHVSKWLDGRETIFIGDGDAMGLVLLRLQQTGVLSMGPKAIQLLDFDERILRAAVRFAETYGLTGAISCRLYNVAEPLPADLIGRFDAFYTNPPFGSANDGHSVAAFVRRGIEATGAGAIGAMVLADDAQLPWTQDVLLRTQTMLTEQHFSIAEMVPEFHQYHLDDEPELRSCSLIARRFGPAGRVVSEPLEAGALDNFYGRAAPLRGRYVRQKGVAEDSTQYEIERLNMDQLELWNSSN